MTMDETIVHENIRSKRIRLMPPLIPENLWCKGCYQKITWIILVSGDAKKSASEIWLCDECLGYAASLLEGTQAKPQIEQGSSLFAQAIFDLRRHAEAMGDEDRNFVLDLAQSIREVNKLSLSRVGQWRIAALAGMYLNQDTLRKLIDELRE
jgi:hypothetical protein